MYTKNPNEGQYYEIRVAGHLDDARATEFGSMCVTRLPDGETLVSGRIVDQAALFGCLIRIRDLGIPLISVNRTASPEC